MSNKNHEQYLEQIETAVAETTQKLFQEDALLTRRMARMVAEKQVEIDRLKEHQSDDRSTIRNLRAHFKEAVNEATELKSEVKKLEEERPEGGWDGQFAKDACEYRRMADSYDNLSIACQLNKEENEKLKGDLDKATEVNDELKSIAFVRRAGELEDINTRWAEDKEADRIEIDGLKDENLELRLWVRRNQEEIDRLREILG